MRNVPARLQKLEDIVRPDLRRFEDLRGVSTADWPEQEAALWLTALASGEPAANEVLKQLTIGELREFVSAIRQEKGVRGLL